jgi:hypothetical protein
MTGFAAPLLARRIPAPRQAIGAAERDTTLISTSLGSIQAALRVDHIGLPALADLHLGHHVAECLSQPSRPSFATSSRQAVSTSQ